MTLLEFRGWHECDAFGRGGGLAGLPEASARRTEAPGGAGGRGARLLHGVPRNCRVNRLANKKAACKTGRSARAASHFPHFGEEDCLCGWGGSGTIFFSWRNLRYVFIGRSRC